MLLHDDWIADHILNKQKKLRVIGRIDTADNDVRRKSASSFVWLTARPKAVIYEGDSFFSGESSAFDLKIDGDVKVEVGQNSLIRLGRVGSELSVSLQMGITNLELTSKKGVYLNTASQQLYLKSTNDRTQVKIAKSESGDLEVISSDANLTIESMGQKWNNTPNQKLVLNKAMKSNELLDKLVLPPHWPEPEVIPPPPLEPLPPPPAEKLSEPKVMAKPKPKKTKPKPEKPVVPAEAIALLEAPELISPANGALVLEFKADDKNARAVFLWKAVANAESYNIEFASDESFQKIMKTYKSQKPSLLLRARIKGVIYWRVQSVQGDLKSEWSTVYSFKVMKH